MSNQNNKRISREVITSWKVLILGAMFVCGMQYLSAATWQAPASAPVAGNVVGGITSDAVDQTKSGFLRVGGLVADNRIFASTLAVPSNLPGDVLAFVGGIAQATDFCLNLDPSNLCFSKNKNKMIFSAKSSWGGGLALNRYCNPARGDCGQITAVSSAIKVPQSLTLKNLRVQTVSTGAGVEGPSNAWNCQFVVTTNSCSDLNAGTETGLTCTTPIVPGNFVSNSCSNLTTTISVLAGDCISLKIKRPGQGTVQCQGQNFATWSFEGNY